MEIDGRHQHTTVPGWDRRGQEISNFRRVLPQFVYSQGISLLLFNIGLAVSYPTIVVNYFLVGRGNQGIQDGNRTIPENVSTTVADEGFTLDASQASHYVSFMYLFQPLGSILGGILIEPIGRKYLMLLANLPFILGWIVLYMCRSHGLLYLSNILMGIGIGLCESPIATYVPEISEPALRGILLGLVQIFLSLSFLMPYLLALIKSISWRGIGLCQTAFPVLTVIFVAFCPESPIWYVSKGRIHQAGESLAKLRGWTERSNIEGELQAIIEHHKAAAEVKSNATLNAMKSTDNLVTAGRLGILKEIIGYYTSLRMRLPFLTICTMFALMNFSGMITMRPYMGKVLQDMNHIGDVQAETTYITLVGVVGAVMTIFIIRFTGKKPLYLLSLLLCGASMAVIGISTIEKFGFSTKVGLSSFYVLSFFSSLSVIPIPWMYQGDLYPFRGRGIASSFSAAFSYISGFTCTKVFLQVVSTISLHGVIFLMSAANFIGFMWAYHVMPETEGKSFEEIDQYYADLEEYKRKKKL